MYNDKVAEVTAEYRRRRIEIGERAGLWGDKFDQTLYTELSQELNRWRSEEQETLHELWLHEFKKGNYGETTN